MGKVIVEVGMPLKKGVDYYHKMLQKQGFALVYACVTRDWYYTKQNLDGLTENQMKKACIRLRFSKPMLDRTANDADLWQQYQSIGDVFKDAIENGGPSVLEDFKKQQSKRSNLLRMAIKKFLIL